MTSVTIFLFGLILVHNIEASKDGCPPIVQESSHFADTFGNTCFLFVDEEVYWNDARDKCWDMGGELLAVRDLSTMNFIKATLNSKKLGWRNQGVWLGARYYSRKWRWTTGEVIDFQYWSPGQPSKILGLLSVEDCALMRRDDEWQWHDYICGSLKFHYKYICQFRLVKTTAATTTTTTTSSTAVTVAGIHGDAHSQQALYLKGQTAESMVIDDSVGSGLSGRRGHGTAFNSIYQHAAHSSAAAKDNGNMAILTIILIVGGIILLGLLIAFLVVRRRYQHTLKHIDERDTVVHFANRSFTSAHTVLPSPPAPHVFSACHEDSLYLTPVEPECFYEEIKKPETQRTHCITKDFGSFQETAPLAPGGLCAGDMGACGSMLDDFDDSPELPLVSAGSANSMESLDSTKGSMKLKPENVHNDYVDMNGMAVMNSKDSSGTASKESLHGSILSAEGGKAALQDDYYYVNTWKGAQENVYEALP